MNNKDLDSLISLSKISDFNEIYRLLDEAPAIEKGCLFEKYLEYLFKGNGWLVESNSGKNDKGADLLLYHPESPDKAMFVIQAKNHKSPLTFDDTKIELIKFEDQAREEYQCHNYQLISINGYVKEAKKLKGFNMALFDFEKIKSLVTNYKENCSVPTLELAAHNLLTSKEIRRQFEEKDLVAVVQATGTGKSYIIGQAMIDAMPSPCVFLAPSNFILENQKKLLPWRSDVSYITYAKAANLTVEQWAVINPSLIVLDEFHRSGAVTWGKGVKRLIDSCPKAKVLGTTATPIRHLDNERNMVEELFEDNLANELSLHEAIAKNILPSPKYVAGLYSFDETNEEYKKAINNSRCSDDEKAKGLADLKRVNVDWEASSGIPKILDKHLKNLSGKYIVFCESIEHLDEMQEEVSKWFRIASKQRREKTIKRHNYLVHSENNVSDNKSELNAFDIANGSSGVHILLSVNMLNEGLHIKQVNGVILLRKTTSPIIYLQQLGRFLQVSSEVDPIVFDFVNNIHNLGTHSFQNGLSAALALENEKRIAIGLEPNKVQVNICDEVLDTSRELEIISSKLNLGISSFDFGYEKLEEFVKEFRHARPVRSHKTKDGFPLGQWVKDRRSSKDILTSSRILRLESLEGWTWDANKFLWDQAIKALDKYVAKVKHARPPPGHKTKDGFPLGQWVMDKRSGKENLTSDRKLQLESFEGWTWDTNKFAWNKSIEALEQYVTEFKNARPKATYKTEDGYALGNWVTTQRSGKEKLTSERRLQLESFEGWTWDTNLFAWEQGIKALEQYVAEFKHARPTNAHKTEDGYALGNWVGDKRWSKQELTQDKILQLESLEGWTWNAKQFAWDQGIEALEKYIIKVKHARPPKAYKTEDAYPLGQWVKDRRSGKKKLTPAQISQLEAFEGWTWDTNQYAWDQGIEALKQYVTEFKNARPKATHKTEDGYALGSWITTQRSYREQLASDRRLQLESFKGWTWDANKFAWDKGIEELTKYVTEVKHARPPQSYKTEDGYALGSWVMQKRKRKTKLTKDEISQLESFDGWLWNARR